jgi:hypothetical protein
VSALRYYLMASLGIALLACSAGPDESKTEPAASDSGAGQDDGGKSDAPALAQQQCPAALSACDGLCLNLAANEEHCGACDHACAMDEVCVAGACKHDPEAGPASHIPDGMCDPKEPVWECGPQSHCLPQADGVSLCHGPAGHREQYDACNGMDHCAPGFQCIETSQDAYCMQWCTNDLDCPGNESGDRCVMLAEALFVGQQEYGVCWDGKP